MKIKHTVGDVFSNREGVIVNLCNKEGKMLSVTSLRIKNKWPIVYDQKNKWPIVYDQYVEYLCDSRPSIGDMQWNRVGDNLYVANIIAQDTCVCSECIDYKVLYKCFLKVFIRCVRVGILIVCVPKPRIGVYGASSLSTMIYAAKEAQWDGTLNICTPCIDNDS